MKLRKLLAIMLACALIMSLSVAAAAEGIDIVTNNESVPEEPVVQADTGWSMDCEGWWTDHSAPVVVTEELQSWTFHSVTYATAANIWNGPLVVVWRSNDGNMLGAGYTEEIVARGDNYGWGNDANPHFAHTCTGELTLEQLKAGVDCTVTAKIVGEYILLGYQVGGMTRTYILNKAEGDAPVYLSLTGEQCVLSNFQSSSNHIDLSAAEATIKGEETEWVIDCTGFGSNREILTITTEPQTWTFTSTSKAVETPQNWFTPIVEVYTSAWEATYRSDSYGWSVNESAIFGANAPADWAAWVADNLAGVECKVTAQVVEGTNGNYIIVGFTNNGVTNIYTVPVTGTLENPTIHLTGEQCVLTNLAESEEHIDLSDAIAATKKDPTNPGTGDILTIVMMAAMATSGAALTVIGKRFFAK